MSVTSCSAAREQFALLLYGELSFDEEEVVDAHLDGCAECRASLEKQRQLHAAFDSVAVEPPASLLRECRAGLSLELGAALEMEARPMQPHAGWWDHFVSLLTGASVLRPAGAMALLALGFFAARMTPLLSQPFGGNISEAGVARVRDVQTAPDGRVRIVVDETRQRTIQGGLDDQKIQNLLLEAVRNPDDGVRSDSVELLKNVHAQSSDVRDALIYELQNDENTGVRLKALAGLKSFVHDPEVRTALIQTLLSAPNAGVRSEAINVLVQSAGENPDRQVIGALQELMLREKDAGLRQQSQRVLASFNASADIY